MKTYKNKVSGKYFIFINNSGQDEALFVTPSCEIKSINKGLLSEAEEGDENYFISQKLISKEQVERYAQYNEDRSGENYDAAKMMFEEMTDFEKQQLLKELRES